MWKINPAHIYYTKSTKKYCKEQAAHITAFKQVNKDALMGARILHDDGGAYKLDGFLILEEFANKIIVLPPNQHGELSVLDNKLNAVAKAMWKAERTNVDFAYDSLLLLHCINRMSDESISLWWDQNFMLKQAEVTLKAVEAQLSSEADRQFVKSFRTSILLHMMCGPRNIMRLMRSLKNAWWILAWTGLIGINKSTVNNFARSSRNHD